MSDEDLLEDDEEKLPFTGHLEELRTRLIRCFIAVLIGAGSAYAFKEKLFDLLTRPLLSVMQEGGKIIFTGLPEAFFTYLKVSLLAGVFLAAPIIVFEFWMFITPGLYKKERLMLAPIILLSSLFFVGGSLFGYFVVFPWGFQFFLDFQSETIQALPSMKEYLGFASKLLIAFGVVFELPIIITCMAAIGLVTPAFLRKNRKYALVLFFIGAAILTPPDVVTQVMMAMPLILLYELSIIGAVIFGRKPLDDDDDEEEDTEDVEDSVDVSE